MLNFVVFGVADRRLTTIMHVMNHMQKLNFAKYIHQRRQKNLHSEEYTLFCILLYFCWLELQQALKKHISLIIIHIHKYFLEFVWLTDIFTSASYPKIYTYVSNWRSRCIEFNDDIFMFWKSLSINRRNHLIWFM